MSALESDEMPPPPVAAASAVASEEEEVCAICLDPLCAGGDEVTKLPCSHAFHAKCVDDLRSFGINNQCPMCRADLPPGPMQLHQDAALRYLALKKAVLKANEGTWSVENMTPEQEAEAEAILATWTEASGAGGPAAALALCGIGVFLNKVRERLLPYPLQLAL
jgi:hypothetical protein